VIVPRITEAHQEEEEEEAAEEAADLPIKTLIQVAMTMTRRTSLKTRTPRTRTREEGKRIGKNQARNGAEDVEATSTQLEIQGVRRNKSFAVCVKPPHTASRDVHGGRTPRTVPNVGPGHMSSQVSVRLVSRGEEKGNSRPPRKILTTSLLLG
jgi:hypothetical protein